MNVQFESADSEVVRTHLAILGIPVEVHDATPNKVIARYDDWRSAEKLRTYLESHHCSETAEGKIATLPVDGWDELVKASQYFC